MGAIKINGETSGSTTITAPATGSDETIELSTALASKLDSSAYTAPGLVLITTETFSAVSSVSLNGCFTSAYQNYRVICKLQGSSNANAVTLRLRASGSDNSTSDYGYAYTGLSFNGTSRNVNSAGTTSLFLGNSQSATGSNHYSLDIGGPQTGDHTTFVGSVVSISSSDTALAAATAWHVGARFQATTVFDGFSLIVSAGNMTGIVRVYGYKD